jgi:hypothetical protein
MRLWPRAIAPKCNTPLSIPYEISYQARAHRQSVLIREGVDGGRWGEVNGHRLARGSLARATQDCQIRTRRSPTMPAIELASN